MTLWLILLYAILLHVSTSSVNSLIFLMQKIFLYIKVLIFLSFATRTTNKSSKFSIEWETPLFIYIDNFYLSSKHILLSLSQQYSEISHTSRHTARALTFSLFLFLYPTIIIENGWKKLAIHSLFSSIIFFILYIIIDNLEIKVG